LQAGEFACTSIDDEAAVTQVVTAFDVKLGSIRSMESISDTQRAVIDQVRTALCAMSGGDPLEELFGRIAQQASDLYGAAWRPAELSIAHSRSHPRGSEDPYPVTGSTVWLDEPDTAEVELQIFVERFGPAAYAALPLILIHECVCHVPARQEKVKNDSEFAEGLMDWAACYFHDNWAAKLDPEFAQAAWTHGDRLKALLLAGRSRESRARVAGHQAVGCLQVWLQDECQMSLEQSRSHIARLAVEMNIVNESIAAKDHFVTRLSRPFEPRLEEVLRAWVNREATTDDLLAVPAVSAA
jgi:hypothetical protein